MRRVKTKISWEPVVIGKSEKKVKDFSRSSENSLVDAIYSQLIMRKGVLTNNRDIGCWEILNRIPFSDDIQLRGIEKELSDQLSLSTDVTVSVNLSKDTGDEEMINVLVTIDGLPDDLTFSMDLLKRNANLVLTTPQVLQPQ